MRHLLDIHAAGGGGDECHPAPFAVESQRQVQLTRDLGARLDVYALDRQAFGPGLLCDERLSEHALGRRAHRLDFPRQLDTARLAAAARVHLGLHHPRAPRESAGGFHGLFGTRRDLAGGNRDAVAAEDVLRLVLVQVHVWARAGKARILLEKGRG